MFFKTASSQIAPLFGDGGSKKLKCLTVWITDTPSVPKYLSFSFSEKQL
jgi:hypothetical protein